MGADTQPPSRRETIVIREGAGCFQHGHSAQQFPRAADPKRFDVSTMDSAPKAASRHLLAVTALRRGLPLRCLDWEGPDEPRPRNPSLFVASFGCKRG